MEDQGRNQRQAVDKTQQAVEYLPFGRMLLMEVLADVEKPSSMSQFSVFGVRGSSVDVRE